MATRRVLLSIYGMRGQPCAERVSNALRQVGGVTHVDIDLDFEQAVVSYLPNAASEEALKQAVRSIGYQVPE